MPVGLQRERLRELDARLGGRDDAEFVDTLLVTVVTHLQEWHHIGLWLCKWRLCAASAPDTSIPSTSRTLPLLQQSFWCNVNEKYDERMQRTAVQSTFSASCISWVASASLMVGSLASWSRNSGRAR